MFDAFHRFLYDNNLWVIPLVLVVAGYFSWRIKQILFAEPVPAEAVGRQTRRTARPMPVDAKPADPIQQKFLPDKPASVAVGEESHKHKAQAPTLRIRSDDLRQSTSGGSTTELLPAKGDAPTVGDEVGALFAGLDDTLQPAATTPAVAPADTHDKANRLEVLGFHHSIESTRTPPPGTITAPPETPAPAPAAPAAATTAPAAAPALDDILARLDRVLADDQPAKPAVAPAPTSTGDKPKAPVWARADAQDEDIDAKPAEPGQQLGLFDEDKKA